MSNPICTNFIDEYGKDLGSTLVSKEYMLENYSFLLSQDKMPGLWMVGANNYGALGDNTNINKSSPVLMFGNNWKSIAASDNYSAGIKTDGTLWNWGCNLRSQVSGGGSSNEVSTPVQTTSGGTNWKSVAVGGPTVGTTAAIKTDGTLWVWGWNEFGADGPTPTQLFVGTCDWSKLAVGYRIIYSIKTDGTLWGWGLNSFGQLGSTNTTSLQSSPMQTTLGGNNWKSINVSSGSSPSKSYAIKNDGTLWGWGYNNSNGDLGIGCTTATYISIPTQICVGSTNWRQVSSGCYHTLAVKTDGTLWGWGSNTCYAIPLTKCTPFQISSGTNNWRQASAGSTGSSAAIKTDGTLWVWGNNTYGQLGINNTTTITTPTQSLIGGYTWKEVSVGSCHMMSISELCGI